MSRLAILVNYRSAHGGLHDHVRDQLAFARNLGYDVTLACPPGEFATEMSTLVDVVESDFTDPDATAIDVLDIAGVDLIHAHPGKAREAAFAMKERNRVPLLVTYHGNRPETLTAASPDVDIAVTVSEVTRRYILRKTDVDPERVVVIPNAVDLDTFVPHATQPERPGILFASRWDADKQFVVDVTIEAIEAIAMQSRFEGLRIAVAGDGTELSMIEAACTQARARLRGSADVESLGWLPPERLAEQMADASVVVAPGRGALQGLAVGRPTIALGSKGYVGFLAGQNLLRGIDANFGSGGIGPRQYQSGRVADDLHHALQAVADQDLRSAYRIIAGERSLSAVEQAHARVWSIALTMGIPGNP